MYSMRPVPVFAARDAMNWRRECHVICLGEKKRRVGAVWTHGHAGRNRGTAAFPAEPDAECILAQTYNVDGGNWMS
jgi:hypothetical protein